MLNYSYIMHSTTAAFPHNPAVRTRIHYKQEKTLYCMVSIVLLCTCAYIEKHRIIFPGQPHKNNE